MSEREIYTIETPDALRDGLFLGFWRHRNQTEKTPAVGAGALGKGGTEDAGK